MKTFLHVLLVISIISNMTLVFSGDFELILLGLVGGIIEIGLLVVLLKLFDKQQEMDARIKKIANNMRQTKKASSLKPNNSHSIRDNNQTKSNKSDDSDNLYYVEKLQKVVSVVEKKSDGSYLVKSAESGEPDSDKRYLVIADDLE